MVTHAALVLDPAPGHPIGPADDTPTPPFAPTSHWALPFAASVSPPGRETTAPAPTGAGGPPPTSPAAARPRKVRSWRATAPRAAPDPSPGPMRHVHRAPGRTGCRP